MTAAEPLYHIDRNNSTKNIDIQSATLNGQPLTIPVIRYDEVVAGAS
jgi:hypothetical protein